MVNVLLLLASTLGLQDPTQPLRTAPSVPAASPQQGVAAAPPSLRLEAIFTGGHDSAIIDGKRYRVGDKVQNYRLTRINASQVLLQNQSQVLTLTLFPSLSMPSN